MDLMNSFEDEDWLKLHWENYISNYFHIEWDMIVVTIFLLILNQIEFHLVQNRKENCHHDHIPFNMKGNGILVFSVFSFCRSYIKAKFIVYCCETQIDKACNHRRIVSPMIISPALRRFWITKSTPMKEWAYCLSIKSQNILEYVTKL